MLIGFAMICSCQKQNSAAEQQLAQRKTELDARETALDEREHALNQRQQVLDGREKGLAERGKAIGSARAIPRIQGQTPDPGQVNAERDRKIQQLPPELQALIAAAPDASQLKAERDSKMQARSAQRQLGPEDLNRQWQRKMMGTSGGAVFPAPEASSPTPSPAVEATSPTPSPTPQ